MDEQSDIIVFRHFDNAIDANIVKTKLDAYGVPCFLTEENMANLYPGANYNVMAFRVRLHLFAHDAERATKILEENYLQTDDDTIHECPRCRSKNIERDFPKSANNDLITIIKTLFFSILFPQKRVYHCLDCELEFN